jgi:Ca2+-binding EF-hand superfamily protein
MGSKIKIFILIISLALSVSLFSDKKGKSKNRKTVIGGQHGIMFNEYDKNKDGKISKAEFNQVFSEMDLDKDGYVGLYETNEYYKKIKAKLDNKLNKEFDK